MKAFNIKIKIYATRIGNPYSLEVSKTIDVDNDRKLDEILDIPIGRLILGDSYKPKDLDITTPEEPQQTKETDSDVTDIVIVQGMERDNIYDMEYIHDAVCDRLEDIMSNARPNGTRYDIILREIIPIEKQEPVEQTDSIQSFAKKVNEYLESHRPTADDIERFKEIPAWWDKFISGGTTDDSE